MKNSQQQYNYIFIIILISLAILMEFLLIIYIVTNSSFFQFIFYMFIMACANSLLIFLKDFKGSNEEILFKQIMGATILWIFSLLGWILIANFYTLIFS